jgi:hypothetical protein
VRKRLEAELAELRFGMELIKDIVMVREPATMQTAEAYEGLRKQVIASAAERNSHLTQLARLDAEAHRGASVEDIQLLLRDLLAEAGLHRVESVDGGSERLFDDLGGRGDTWQVVEPAYCEDTGRGQVRLVRSGKAQRVDGAASASSSSVAESDTLEEVAP